MKIYISGKLLPERDAKVSVFDHGLLYGDGVFEGIRAYNGRVFMLDRHIDRLFDSAKAIALTVPMTREGVARAVVRTCKANGLRDGYIRLVVTRGVGELGLNPYLCKRGEVIVIAGRIQLYPPKLYRDGLSIITVAAPRNHPEALNPAIKSLNYLNNILAKIEAINSGVMEAVMLNVQGQVCEATGDNIFTVKDSVISTPPPEAGILRGITRDVVMRIARDEGYEVRERMMSRYDLYTADEVFLTGTAAEVIGVINIDRRPIGGGKPGPATRFLARKFHQFAATTGEPIR
jgi:branched-chain amino acid aminotransferase